MHRRRTYSSSEFPEITCGGSSEISRVRFTFERLYKLVRAANMAFFMGDITLAYSTLEDALVLFKKLDNRKAIGIANNNLGNVMLTLYRAMKKTGAPTLCDMTRKKIIQKGCGYFRNAIDMGEEALTKINDDEGFSVNYLIFMQQLSNRYFNRAIFLLTVRNDHVDSSQAEMQGMMDIATCKDMDREVVDNGDQVGFKGDKEVYFELLMGRIKGLLLLMKLGYEDPWGIEELFDEARSELQSAMRTADHPLFSDMDPAGQMQRLDGALIEYHLYMAGKEDEADHLEKASLIGIRMLVEDDYVIGEAALLALRALLDSGLEAKGLDASDVRSELFHCRHRISEMLSLSYSGKDLVSRECFHASNVGDFSMEVF